MFDELTKKHLNENPYSIIAGKFYKFDSTVMTEGGQSVAIFKNVISQERKNVSFVEYQNLELSPVITALGLMFEKMNELKQQIEIANLK